MLGLNQTVVLWNYNSRDNNGEVIVDDPVEIKLYWNEEKHNTTDSNGNTVLADIKLITGELLTVGSILWLGRIRDLPTLASNLFSVVSAKKVPDLKGRDFTYSASLIRYKNVYPTTA